MWSVVWIVWSPPGSSEMTTIWITIAAHGEPGRAQRQVGERGEAPARERDAREARRGRRVR